MMPRITALFDHSNEAVQTMKTLDEAGFECIRVDNDNTDPGKSGPLDADDLIRLGVAGSEAQFYSDALHRGGSLLVITGEQPREEKIEQIMRRAGLKRVPADEPEHIRFEKPQMRAAGDDELIDQSGVHRVERMQREYREADSERMVGEYESGDSTGLSRHAYGPEGSAAGSEPGEEIPELTGAMPEEYARFERACRHHYEEYFAATEAPYRSYIRAYLYGMMLADEDEFREREWNDIETFARQGWDPQTHGRWEDFAPAVHFGWQLMRGASERPQPGL